MKKILDKIEELRLSDSGRTAFYLMLGILIGAAAGIIIAPKVIGSFNGCLSGNSASASGNSATKS